MRGYFPPKMIEAPHLECYRAVPAHMLWSNRGRPTRRAGFELAFTGRFGHHLGRIPPSHSASLSRVEHRGVRKEDESAEGHAKRPIPRTMGPHAPEGPAVHGPAGSSSRPRPPPPLHLHRPFRSVRPHAPDGHAPAVSHGAFRD